MEVRAAHERGRRQRLGPQFQASAGVMKAARGADVAADDAQGEPSKEQQAVRAQSLLELRRRRNRESMRRARVRQRAERARMQKMIDQLETQLRLLLRRQPAASFDGSSGSTTYRLSAYSGLLRAGEALRAQNVSLTRDVQQHEAFQRMLARESADELASHAGRRRDGAAAGSSADEDEDAAPSPLPAWLAPEESQRELLAFARDMFLANAERTDLLLPPGGTVLGWHDKRGVLDDSWAQFVQTKDFPNESAEALLARTWAASTDLVQMRALLSWAAGMKLLHRIGDSAVVVARELRMPSAADVDPPRLYRYTLLVHKAPIDGGFMLCTQTISLDGARGAEEALAQRHLRRSGLPLVTMYGLAFTRLTGRDRGCRVRLSGRTSDGSIAYAHKVLVESLPAVLRWEHNCVAPILRLDAA